MSAPTRPRPPSRRSVARGSAVGLGLLVASTAFAPAALAADDPTDPVAPDTTPDAPASTPVALNPSPAASAAVSGPVAADFGSGKQFDLALSVDSASTAPDDLSLAGAKFAFTRDGETDPASICVTDAAGSCTVTYGSPGGTGSSVSLSNGDYTVTQVAGVDGLAPVAGVVGTVTMDASWFMGFGPFGNNLALGITNVSEYSRQVRATVVDASTGDPLPGADFSLTGPWYPSTDPQAPDSYESGPVTSDDDGVLTFDGPFRPEDWTLTPGSVPDGYVLGDELTVTVPSTPGFAGPQSWVLADPIEVLATTPPPQENPDGTSELPTPPVVVPPAPVAPTAAPPSSAPASSSAPSRPRPVAPVAPEVVAPAPEPVAVPTATYDGRSSLPQEDRSPNTGPAPALLAAPQLQTASSSFPAVGLVGIGVLFVAVVAAGVVFLRRRMLRG